MRVNQGFKAVVVTTVTGSNQRLNGQRTLPDMVITDVTLVYTICQVPLPSIQSQALCSVRAPAAALTRRVRLDGEA